MRLMDRYLGRIIVSAVILFWWTENGLAEEPTKKINIPTQVVSPIPKNKASGARIRKNGEPRVEYVNHCVPRPQYESYTRKFSPKTSKASGTLKTSSTAIKSIPVALNKTTALAPEASPGIKNVTLHQFKEKNPEKLKSGILQFHSRASDTRVLRNKLKVFKTAVSKLSVRNYFRNILKMAKNNVIQNNYGIFGRCIMQRSIMQNNIKRSKINSVTNRTNPKNIEEYANLKQLFETFKIVPSVHKRQINNSVLIQDKQFPEMNISLTTRDFTETQELAISQQWSATARQNTSELQKFSARNRKSFGNSQEKHPSTDISVFFSDVTLYEQVGPVNALDKEKEVNFSTNNANLQYNEKSKTNFLLVGEPSEDAPKFAPPDIDSLSRFMFETIIRTQQGGDVGEGDDHKPVTCPDGARQDKLSISLTSSATLFVLVRHSLF